MNTRLQVEHPVTELVTGLDIVKLQFQIAAGERLPFTQADLSQRGHAIECRIYAEDPYNGFLPAIGTIERFIAPEGPGIRVDSGVQSGDAITIHYDPMIAKLIVYDSTRAGAIRRMQTALAQTVILGTTTNIPFLQSLLAHPAFAAGTVDTRFVDQHLDELLPEQPPLPDAALVAAALGEMQGIGVKADKARLVPTDDGFDPWARRDGFRVGG
jgi:3-methylcrotonyl-CoA carboxylase alpha subunit